MVKISVEEYKKLTGKGKRKYGNKKVYFNEYTNQTFEEYTFKKLVEKKEIDINNFVKFDSIQECNYYKDLLILVKVGEIKHIELQPKFTLIPRFEKDGMIISAITYTADFKVSYSNGKVEVIDVKGMVTNEFKTRWKLFEYKYPDMSLRVIDKFGKDIPLYKKRGKNG